MQSIRVRHIRQAGDRTWFASPVFSPRRGFSLAEMLVVVVIGGVLGAMSYGKINLINNDRRLNSAISAVQNDVEAAFSLAARNRVPSRITWTASKQDDDRHQSRRDDDVSHDESWQRVRACVGET